MVGVVGMVLGAAIGRWWGRTEGRREGKQEAIGDALRDKDSRLDRGREALRDGRGAGDPAERLRKNDGRW